MRLGQLQRVGIFGLGEAGSEIAANLVELGVVVRGYDPADVPTPNGVERHARPDRVVQEIDCLLAVTAARDAATALRQALDDIPEGLLYADLSTSSPVEKRRLGAIADGRAFRFVDGALMATVPGKGIQTPQLASGAAAETYAAALATVGAPVSVVGREPGAASTHKLLRSIVTKGLGALLLEARSAARAAGLEEWLWQHLVSTITEADEAFMVRLMDGMGRHAIRRHEEMQASASLLKELGVSPIMTSATQTALHDLMATGNVLDDT